MRSSNIIETLEARSYLSASLTESVAFSTPASGQLKPGQKLTEAITVTNGGTNLASGAITITAGLSSNSTGASPLDTLTTTKPIHLKAGAHEVIKLSIKVPVGFVPGTYFATAALTPNAALTAAGVADGSVVSTDTITVLDPFPNLVGIWTGTFKITKGLDKGLVFTSTRNFTVESDTTGKFTCIATNHYPGGTSGSSTFSGTISTAGAYTSSDPGAGIIKTTAKLKGDTLKGSYVADTNSGTFVWTRND